MAMAVLARKTPERTSSMSSDKSYEIDQGILTEVAAMIMEQEKRVKNSMVMTFIDDPTIDVDSVVEVLKKKTFYDFRDSTLRKALESLRQKN